MPRSLTFLLEDSRSAIYQRIVNALSRALEDAGHHVVWLHYSENYNYSDLLNLISSRKIDAAVITNNSGLLSVFFKEADKFLFELVGLPVIFLHYENIFSSCGRFNIISKKIQAFKSLKGNSYHFCIEPYNCVDLECLGIPNAYTILHASEFVNNNASSKRFQLDASFIGHLVPNTLDWNDDSIPLLISSEFWSRVENLDYKIEPGCIAYANKSVVDVNDLVEWYSAKHWHLSQVHCFSQAFRGEIISRIGDYSIDIFGGDPGYLSGGVSDRKIRQQNLNYHPPISDYSKAADLYRTSRINLNITSLQFDDAVINRVIDAGAAGGFILTDHKAEINNITSVHKEISFRTIDELNEKIEYYLTHEQERMEIARQLNHDVKKNCAYKAVVGRILEKIHIN